MQIAAEYQQQHTGTVYSQDTCQKYDNPEQHENASIKLLNISDICDLPCVIQRVAGCLKMHFIPYSNKSKFNS
jgi:hypothetical protein